MNDLYSNINDTIYKLNPEVEKYGTQVKDFHPTIVRDYYCEPPCDYSFQSICAIPEYSRFSQEELRLIDYRNFALRRNTSLFERAEDCSKISSFSTERQSSQSQSQSQSQGQSQIQSQNQSQSQSLSQSQSNRLNAKGYYTLPSLDSLRQLLLLPQPHGTTVISRFRIVRPGFGEVVYDQIDLGEFEPEDLERIAGDLVVIEPMYLAVCPRLKNTHTLQGPVTVMLENCFTTEIYSDIVVKDPFHPTYQEFVNYLKARKHTRFIDYIGWNGQWKFRVNMISQL
ncbi:hypothetical protein J3Q64DRAFT_1705997 [Phycomyces blakesleeanus]|uniref:Peptidase S59 domain-containing protein n=1 Tax=Phycomyces blakesleeanus TaxID=4837 RepID=A0ABR3BBI5_PHYBL